MTQPPNDAPASPMQFDTVEPGIAAAQAAPAGLTCLGCRRPITEAYYAIRDKPICAGCCAAVMAKPPGNPVRQFFLAALYGLGAALAGAVLWYAILKFTGHQIGLVAIAVGWAVGKSVLKGSGGRGGRLYQFLAVVLTYGSIALTYMAILVQLALEHPSTGTAHHGPMAAPVAIALLIGLSISAPVWIGIKSPISLLIAGFALWEAWKFTAARKLPITGPYYIAPPLLPLPSGVQA